MRDGVGVVLPIRPRRLLRDNGGHGRGDQDASARYAQAVSERRMPLVPGQVRVMIE